MAKQMSYTTPDGIVHDFSYWLPIQLNFNLTGSGLVVFLGYHTSITRLAGDSPIGSHQYVLDATLMQQYFAVANYINGANPVSQAYLLAMNTLDTGVDNQGKNGQSFFQGATDV